MAKIKFDIPGQVQTRIIVYDILGKEVRTPINEKLKPGEYEIDFKSLQLPSGTYFYKLIIEGHSETKKMLLVK